MIFFAMLLKKSINLNSILMENLKNISNALFMLATSEIFCNSYLNFRFVQYLFIFIIEGVFEAFGFFSPPVFHNSCVWIYYSLIHIFVIFVLL